MKRHGNLFSRIVHPDNLRLAHQNARRGKTHYHDVMVVDADPDLYIDQIRYMLVNRAFSTAPYTQKIVTEPKRRIIYKLPYYPDRIIHHAVMQVMQPLWDKTFIYDLYSAIPGKGLHAGSYRLRKFLTDAENTRYCLKFDITKFYPSIDPNILFEIISRTTKDPDLLWLLHDVIFNVPDGGGIPIGNYLSQYFSNLYLSQFDHWIKEELGCRYYIRYCDDGVILHGDLGRLKQIRSEIEQYLDSIKLTLNPKTSIFPVDRCGIDFLGYRCFRSHTLLRKSSARRLKKRVKRIETEYRTLSPDTVLSTVGSYHGWLKHCNSHNLTRKYLYENSGIRTAIEHATENGGMKWPNWFTAQPSRT